MHQPEESQKVIDAELESAPCNITTNIT